MLELDVDVAILDTLLPVSAVAVEGQSLLEGVLLPTLLQGGGLLLGTSEVAFVSTCGPAVWLFVFWLPFVFQLACFEDLFTSY